eukprot:5881348-Alexandrium_andersonii.AAC.1
MSRRCQRRCSNPAHPLIQWVCQHVPKRPNVSETTSECLTYASWARKHVCDGTTGCAGCRAWRAQACRRGRRAGCASGP